MNPELPKSIRDALAQQPVPATHPSADMLAAFAERALSAGESQRITDHLARCADCREVVFLASSAAEEQELAAAAAPRISPAQTPAAESATAICAKPRWRWTPRLAWAVPVAAAVVVAGGVLLYQRPGTVAPAPQVASMNDNSSSVPPVAEVRAAPASQPELVAKKPATKRQPKAVPAAKPPAPSNSTLASSVPPVVEENRAAPAISLPAATSQSATIAVGGQLPAVSAPAAGPPNAFAFSRTEHSAPSSAIAAPAPQVARRAFSPAPVPWRVTAEGHLERFVQGSWEHVLANETTSFRAVCVLGDEVWAGGNNGTLFHSKDGGQHWIKVALPPPDSGEAGSVVSIQFEDQQHGVVISDSGSRFTTNDGGTNWTKE